METTTNQLHSLPASSFSLFDSLPNELAYKIIQISVNSHSDLNSSKTILLVSKRFKDISYEIFLKNSSAYRFLQCFQKANSIALTTTIFDHNIAETLSYGFTYLASDNQGRQYLNKVTIDGCILLITTPFHKDHFISLKINASISNEFQPQIRHCIPIEGGFLLVTKETASIWHFINGRVDESEKSPLQEVVVLKSIVTFVSEGGFAGVISFLAHARESAGLFGNILVVAPSSRKDTCYAIDITQDPLTCQKIYFNQPPFLTKLGNQCYCFVQNNYVPLKIINSEREGYEYELVSDPTEEKIVAGDNFEPITAANTRWAVRDHKTYFSVIDLQKKTIRFIDLQKKTIAKYNLTDTKKTRLFLFNDFLFINEKSCFTALHLPSLIDYSPEFKNLIVLQENETLVSISPNYEAGHLTFSAFILRTEKVKETDSETMKERSFELHKLHHIKKSWILEDQKLLSTSTIDSFNAEDPSFDNANTSAKSTLAILPPLSPSSDSMESEDETGPSHQGQPSPPSPIAEEEDASRVSQSRVTPIQSQTSSTPPSRVESEEETEPTHYEQLPPASPTEPENSSPEPGRTTILTTAHPSTVVTTPQNLTKEDRVELKSKREFSKIGSVRTAQPDSLGRIVKIAIVIFSLTSVGTLALIVWHPGMVIFHSGGLVLTLPTLLSMAANGSSLLLIAVGSYLWWRAQRANAS